MIDIQKYTELIGCLLYLYYPLYNPFAEENSFEDGHKTAGLFTLDHSQLSDEESNTVNSWKKRYESSGDCMWLRSSKLYKDLGSDYNWDISFGRQITHGLIAEVVIRRTLSTKIDLPDGTVNFVGAGIPPSQFITREVTMFPHYAQEVLAISHEVQKRLWVPNPIRGSLLQFLQSGPNTSTSKESATQLNFGAYRKGILVSSDYRNAILLGRTTLQGEDCC
jgi:hypothetical protein